MELGASISYIELEHALMNAAGLVKDLVGVKRFAASPVSAVVLGSITVEARMGNSGNVYYKDAGLRFALNSLGMPNKGLKYLREKDRLERMVAICHTAGKPLIINIAGFTAKEYGILAKFAVEAGVDAVEVNLGCPNIKDKCPACYSREQTADIANEVNGAVRGRAPVFYKFGPMPDAEFLESQTLLLLDAKGASGFTVTNTYGGGLYFDRADKPVISELRRGGVSGSALLPIGLGMVDQIRQIVGNRAVVIGVGGISTGEHVRQYLLAGADAVQANTVCSDRDGNPGVYGDILADYIDLLPEEG